MDDRDLDGLYSKALGKVITVKAVILGCGDGLKHVPSHLILLNVEKKTVQCMNSSQLQLQGGNMIQFIKAS